MSVISYKDLEPLQESFHQRLCAAHETLCKEILAGFEGRQVEIERKFKGTDGEWGLHTVHATITDVRIGYDDMLILIGTFAHPVNGRPVETEIGI